jgi:hypothetical protein
MIVAGWNLLRRVGQRGGATMRTEFEARGYRSFRARNRDTCGRAGIRRDNEAREHKYVSERATQHAPPHARSAQLNAPSRHYATPNPR